MGRRSAGWRRNSDERERLDVDELRRSNSVVEIDSKPPFNTRQRWASILLSTYNRKQGLRRRAPWLQRAIHRRGRSPSQRRART